MRLTLSLLIGTFLLTSLTFAYNPHYPVKNSNNHLLLSNAPPGLQKKGMSTIPSYLGNVPPGWNEGLKRGWNKSRDWRWNNHTKYWQNKHWQWDNKANGWQKHHGWR